MAQERGIMTPLVLGLGVPELLIILAVMLLLFGGTRLAGLGKSSGRALREFKEETKGLRFDDSQPPNPGLGAPTPTATDYQLSPQADTSVQPPSSGTFQQPPRSSQDPSGTDLRSDT